MGIRTPDIQLAKLALYQLSYTPIVTEGSFSRSAWFQKEKDQIARCDSVMADRAEYK